MKTEMRDGGSLTIERIGEEFDRWGELLDLILTSFASMEGRIEPPSSALGLTPASLSAKAKSEIGFLAKLDERLAGCVFLAERADHFYLGKLAVAPGLQGKGVGRLLLGAAEDYARHAGKPLIELQARIELTENHAAFERLGFVETARTAHAGFDRPTSITMRKSLA